MDILITGCERSGTKMLLEKQPLPHYCEPKELPAFYQGWKELNLYDKFTLNWINLTANNIKPGAHKHSLNMRQGVDFLKFVFNVFPYVQIKYIERDPVAVVQSMILKLWKYPEHTKSIDMAIEQWKYIHDTCLPYVKEKGAEIHRYEDYCENKIILPVEVVSYIQKKVK